MFWRKWQIGVFLGTLVVAGWVLWCNRPSDQGEKERVFIEKTEEENGSQVRVLVLGDDPPFVTKWVDGYRVQVRPPPASAPPEWVKISSTKEGSGDWLELSFEKPSRVVEVVGKKVILHAEGEEEPWCRLSLRAGLRKLSIICPDPRAGNWLEVKSRTLADDDKVFPAGSFRFVNLYFKTVILELGGEELSLPVGKVVVFGDELITELKVRLWSLKSDGEKQLLCEDVVTQELNERTNFFFYPSYRKGQRAIPKVRKIAEVASLE